MSKVIQTPIMITATVNMTCRGLRPEKSYRFLICIMERVITDELNALNESPTHIDGSRLTDLSDLVTSVVMLPPM